MLPVNWVLGIWILVLYAVAVRAILNAARRLYHKRKGNE